MWEKDDSRTHYMCVHVPGNYHVDDFREFRPERRSYLRDSVCSNARLEIKRCEFELDVRVHEARPGSRPSAPSCRLSGAQRRNWRRLSSVGMFGNEFQAKCKTILTSASKESPVPSKQRTRVRAGWLHGMTSYWTEVGKAVVALVFIVSWAERERGKVLLKEARYASFKGPGLGTLRVSSRWVRAPWWESHVHPCVRSDQAFFLRLDELYRRK